MSATHHDDPALITKLLSDVGVFVAHRMGKVSRQRLHEEFQVQTHLSEYRDPVAAVKEFLGQRTKT
jgi:hypothetical protein